MATSYYPEAFVQRVTTTVKKAEGSSSTHSTSSYATSKTQDTVRHKITDDGVGGFGPFGTINYAGKTLTARLVSLNSKTEGYKSDHMDAAEFESTTKFGSSDPAGSSGTDTAQGGTYGDTAVSEELLAASTVTVRYAVGFATPTTQTTTFKPGPVTLDLCPYTSDYIVPGSVMFTWMGHTYQDFDGVLYRDRTSTDAGYVAGQLDYSSGLATVTDYVVAGSPTDFVLNSLWTVRQNWNTASIFFRTQAAPVKPSGVTLSLTDAIGNPITATGDANGIISGDHLRGVMEYETGMVELQFGDFVFDTALTDAEKLEWWYDPDNVGAVQPLKIWRPWPVDPTTLRYNSVAYFYLPLDAELLGIDPVRLPQDGRVTIFQPGFRVVVGHSKKSTPVAVSNGQTFDLARTRLSRVRVLGNDGQAIHTGYTNSLEAGTVTFTDVAGYSQPITLEDRIEDMAIVGDVGIDGTLKLTRPLTHDFPLGSYVSSALMAGDLKARVSVSFDQATWDGVTFSDVLIGNVATGTYNDVLAPMEVTNAGALTERWVFQFTNATTYRVIGENVGVVVANGDTNTDCAPINPITGLPYFTLRAIGWGGGWAAGNILRRNTVGAMFTYNVIRTVQAGPEAGQDYAFSLLTRGDVDRP